VSRNAAMAERIAAAPVSYPFRFVVLGDSGAWPDPTADGIHRQLLGQVAELDPAPVFLANLGDFAGPGHLSRHRDYLALVDDLPVPNLCVIGNHDLDEASGWDTFEEVHGPVNFDFAYGHTRFVALHCELHSGGPRAEDLAYLDERLTAAEEPHRVLLMHMPPYLDGHFDPHPDWGFNEREDEFFALLAKHDVGLVCCAHVCAHDELEHDGVRFVVSGGGGTGICSHWSGGCVDRSTRYHVVEITVSETGALSRRVIRAFDR
jgi:Calcineurin-like phosphoesterase